jgi:exodeoxyribonuclease VII large subunit
MDPTFINGDMGKSAVQSVSQLTARIKQTLETAFPEVLVAGELTDVVRAHSGHIYLTLKDAQAQLRAVIWRGVAGRLDFELQDGQEVVCRGDLDVYPPRGSYQLVIRSIEPLGLGALQLALKRLQQRLAAEGLFEAERKRPLPRFPRRIGFVTSPTGAAIRDFLEAVRARWQGVHVLVIPARVQGEGAAQDIARGIELANRVQPPLDVLIVGRGGGSLEDLWCFNEELVVRAIHGSRIPVVSAVGHEIDVTLADLVADARALTPTDAARHVVPSADEVRRWLDSVGQSMEARLLHRLRLARSRLESLTARRVLRRPLDRIHELARRVDELDHRGRRAIRQSLAQFRQRLDGGTGRLESLSPLAVLARGYSLTARETDGQLVRDAGSLKVGDRIRSRFSRGRVVSRVEQLDLEQDANTLQRGAPK